MPSKYVLRNFEDDAYLHVYNRGVEKRILFFDEADYSVFMYYLFVYLAKPETVKNTYPKIRPHLLKHSLYGQVELLAYCLMPNHFHLLVHQAKQAAITKLMRQLTNAYTEYFNKKYERVGGLVQGKFKSILVDRDEYLLHLSRYIHRNSLSLKGFSIQNLHTYPWSSYASYINGKSTQILNISPILNFFSNESGSLTYQAFVAIELDTAESLPERYLIEFD